MRISLISLFLFLMVIPTKAQEDSCFDKESDSHYPFSIDSISIPLEDGELHAYLYQPNSDGKYPAAIVMHGGGNNYDQLMNVPWYFARRAAGCGIITLIYDKRGTGRSTMDYSTADFNDFVSDASTTIYYLNSHAKVDTNNIAAFGVSQGGRLVGVLAARNPKVDMIANVSGPINSVVLTRKFSQLNSIRSSNASEELINSITPYWERHYDLLESNNQAALEKLDAEIVELRKEYSRNWLPPLSSEIRSHPIENSFNFNFFDEYARVTIPWLNIYGENDRIVDAKTSSKNLERIRSQSGNERIEIIVLPNSGHGLYDSVAQKQYPFDDEVVKWIISVRSKSDD